LFHRTQGGAGGEIATHAVDAAAWRRGRGADKEPFGRHAIGHNACCRPGEELAQVLHAAVDIAADVVRVVSLDLRRPHHAACDDAFTKAGRKTLDLRL